MTEWWQVLLVAAGGGFVGGSVVYLLKTPPDWVRISPLAGPRIPEMQGRERVSNLPPMTYAQLGLPDDEYGDATLDALESSRHGERSRYGTCRECGAQEDQFCRPGCRLIDRWEPQ